MSAYPPEDRTDHPQIQANPIEENVPNSEKVVPSSRNTVLLLSILAGVAAIAAVVATKGMRQEVLALILAVAALTLGIIAVVMARGDARASTITPGVVTFFAAIITVVVVLDLAEADDAVETGNVPGTTITVPEDPAELAEPQ